MNLKLDKKLNNVEKKEDKQKIKEDKKEMKRKKKAYKRGELAADEYYVDALEAKMEQSGGLGTEIDLSKRTLLTTFHMVLTLIHRTCLCLSANPILT